MTTPLRLTAELSEQLDRHWSTQLRPRLAGLTDEEYLWEPVPDCWSLRPRQATSPASTTIRGGSGEWLIEFGIPEPEPAPVTTIAWRLGHLIVGVFGARAHSHFGAPEFDYLSHDYAPTAAGALRQLDATYTAWRDGVQGLAEDALAAPVGEAEGPHAERSMLTLVLHINREAIHHGAEIALLRDLYAHRSD